VTAPMVLQHEFQIAVADREHQVPSDRPEDHLSGELPPFETPAPIHCRALSRTSAVPMLPQGFWIPNLATEPVRQLESRTAITERGRLAWQVASNYGQRSPIETTMGPYKALIGPRLRARSFAAQ